MFGKAFGGKQNIDPNPRGLTRLRRVCKTSEDRQSQRGLESTDLLLNVDVHHGLFCFLKNKLSGFYPFGRDPPASPELGEGRAD